MSKHLLAIRVDRRTDIQHYTRTLPNSLPILFSPCPFSSLFVLPGSCSPLTPPLLAPPPKLTPTPQSATGSSLPPCLLAHGFFSREFTFLRLWVGEGCCQEATGKCTCLEPIWKPGPAGRGGTEYFPGDSAVCCRGAIELHGITLSFA